MCCSVCSICSLFYVLLNVLGINIAQCANVFNGLVVLCVARWVLLDILCVAQYTHHYSVCCSMCSLFYMYVTTAGMVCSVRLVCLVFYLLLIVLVILYCLGHSMFVLLNVFITCCSMCSLHATPCYSMCSCVHHQCYYSMCLLFYVFLDKCC